jgi:hypothetical protein
MFPKCGRTIAALQHVIPPQPAIRANTRQTTEVGEIDNVQGLHHPQLREDSLFQ